MCLPLHYGRCSYIQRAYCDHNNHNSHNWTKREYFRIQTEEDTKQNTHTYTTQDTYS